MERPFDDKLIPDEQGQPRTRPLRGSFCLDRARDRCIAPLVSVLVLVLASGCAVRPLGLEDFRLGWHSQEAKTANWLLGRNQGNSDLTQEIAMARLMIIRRIAAFMVCAAVAFSCPLEADQESNEERELRDEFWELESGGPIPQNDHQFILPDPYIVKRKCEAIKSAPEPMKADGEFGMGWRPSEKTVRSNMVTLCEKAERGAIGYGEWWQDFHEQRESWIYGHYDCPNCSLLVAPPGEILPDNFTTYALLLIPNAPLEFNDRYNKERLLLWRAFKNFGDAIGSRHAAVWLQPDDTYPSLDYDVERSKYFCDQFQLEYNRGPFVVLTSSRPDLPVTKKESRIVLRLTDLPPSRIVSLLNIVEQDIRKGQEQSRGRLVFEELKGRILSIVEENRDLFRDLVLETWPG